MNSTPTHAAHSLLLRAHSPDTARLLFTDRVKNRPLILRPTSPPPPASSSSSSNINNRERRRLERLRKREYFLRKRKPRPLSAKEKRVSGVHDLGRDEAGEGDRVDGKGNGKRRKLSWAVYEGLNRLWMGYVWEVLGLEPQNNRKTGAAVSTQHHGPLLASLDYHGAKLEVVRCRCVGRVGTNGIVVRDTKFTFVLVTRQDEVRVIPKRNTIFRFEVPLPEKREEEQEEEEKASAGQRGEPPTAAAPAEAKPLVFELHGNQFEMRAADRANKKFKWRSMKSI